MSPHGPIGSGLTPDIDLRYASYSGDGKYFIVTSYRPAQGNRPVTVYATATGRRVGPQASSMAASIHLSPDGKRIVAGLNPCRAEVWDRTNTILVVHHFGPSGAVVTAAFRSDGRAILTASQDGRVRLSALTENSSPRTFAVPVQGAPHDLKVASAFGFTGPGLRCLAVSPNGRWLFVGGWDQTGWLLNAVDGSLQGKITEHKKIITVGRLHPGQPATLHGE